MQWWLRFCSASMKDEDRSPNPGWSVQNFLGIQKERFFGHIPNEHKTCSYGIFGLKGDVQKNSPFVNLRSLNNMRLHPRSVFHFPSYPTARDCAPTALRINSGPGNGIFESRDKIRKMIYLGKFGLEAQPNPPVSQLISSSLHRKMLNECSRSSW